MVACLVVAMGVWYFSHKGKRGVAAFTALDNDLLAVRFEDNIFEHPSSPGASPITYEDDEIEMEAA